MKRRLKIGVVMGGPSAEREISFLTGRAVAFNLDRKKYSVSIVEMTREGRFFLVQNKKERLLDLQNKDRKLFDLIFIALHGPIGEDGSLQGMFEVWGIRYTGSGVLASALAMNKVAAADVYRAHNLPTPPFIDFTKESWKKERALLLKRIIKEIKYPLVLKPADQGSAVGVAVIKSEAKLIAAVNKTINSFSHLMAQKFITGEETTCGVLERRGEPFALPPTHILPKLGKFYDYSSKYKVGGSTHICPADFSAAVNAKLQELAVMAHRALGCRGVSRTDIFVAADGNFYVLETNTIPGMTATSLFPEAATQAGISFSRMLDLIIAASF